MNEQTKRDGSQVRSEVADETCHCGHVEDEHDGRCCVPLCHCVHFDPDDERNET